MYYYTKNGVMGNPQDSFSYIILSPCHTAIAYVYFEDDARKIVNSLNAYAKHVSQQEEQH